MAWEYICKGEKTMNKKLNKYVNEIIAIAGKTM